MPAPMDPMTSWSIVIALGLGSYVYFHPTVIRQVESYVKKRISPEAGSGTESTLSQNDLAGSTTSTAESKKSSTKKKKKNPNTKKTRQEPEVSKKPVEELPKHTSGVEESLASDESDNKPARSILKVVEKPKITNESEDAEGFQTVTGSNKKSKSKSTSSSSGENGAPTRKQRQNAAKKAKAKEAKDLEQIAQEQRLREYRATQRREDANGNAASHAPSHGGIASDQARIDATRNALSDVNVTSYNKAVTGSSTIDKLPSDLVNTTNTPTTTTTNTHPNDGADWVTVPEKVRKASGTAPTSTSSNVGTADSIPPAAEPVKNGKPTSTKSSSIYDVLVWDEA